MELYRQVIRKFWWLILIVLVGAAAFLATYLPRLNVDAGTSVLLNEDDPDLAYYNKTRPLWGYDEYAIFCVTGKDWFTPEGVQTLGEIAADLRRVECVQKIVSILDVPLLRQEPDKKTGLRDLLKAPTLSSPEVDFTEAKKELTWHTQARGNLISADGRSLAVLIYLDVSEEAKRLDARWAALQGEKSENPESAAELEKLRPAMDESIDILKEHRTKMVAGVREVAAKWSPRFPEPVRLSGVSIINVNLVEHVVYDIRTFGIVSFGFFTLAFLAFYRRLRWVVLPIVTCLLPVLIIVGAMAMLQMKLTVITSNLPVLLFVLMLPYTVYFIERYRERRALDPSEEPATSTLEAARVIWTPCFFSCTTTMAGFASLMTSGINPVRTFGTMMAVGMGLGLFIVFLSIPSLSRPLPGLKAESAGTQAGTRGFVRFFEILSLYFPEAVLFLTVLALGWGIWGATKLDAETKFTEYFWPKSEVYQGLEYIDRRMGGTTSLEVILKSPKKNFFLTRKGLEAIRAAEIYFDKEEYDDRVIAEVTGNVRSLKTLFDEISKANKSILTLLPLLMSQESARQMIREMTADIANEDFSVARIMVRMRETHPGLHRNTILRGLREHLEKQPELKDLEVRPTGVFLLYANMLNSLIESQKSTFLMVVGAIFLMLAILFRSPLLAFLVLIPQVLPAVIILGVMGWAGVPLDLVTVMIASIAMGVGVDASIQYTIRFKAELAVDGDRREAISRSHATIGRAIWIATSVIVAGFCVLIFSKFVPSVYFGLFTAIAMLMGQLAALTVLPSIFLMTGYPRK